MIFKIEKERVSLRDEVKEFLKDVPKNSKIDLSNVIYFSPSAAHELLCFVREKKLKLINVREDVRRMLEIQIKIRKMKNMPNDIFQLS